MEQLPEEENKRQQYFDLVRPLGDSGLYQWTIYFLAAITFLNNNLTTSIGPFIFYNPSFQCQDSSLTYSECQAKVCALSQSEIDSYPVKQQMISLATEFGPYHCHQSQKLFFYRASLGFGQFIGFFICMMISDNLGRRKAYLICIFFSNCGLVLICLAQNMSMGVIGFILIGMFNTPMLRIIQAIQAQLTDYNLKQKFFSSLLLYSAVALVFIGYLYPLIGDWRKSVFYCALLPGLVIMILFFSLIEDTPKFLLRKSGEEAAMALNRIGRLNSGEDTIFYTPQQIEERIQMQKQMTEQKQIMTPIDLVRFPSLRCTTLLLLGIVCMMDLVYFFHFSVIDKIGVNPKFNSLLIGIGEASGAVWGIFIIPHFYRKSIFLVFMFTCIVISVVTGFISVPDNCEYCSSGILQMGLIAAVRFFVIVIWSTIYSYFSQFFPVSILSIGMGIPTAFGGLGMALCQLIFLSASQNNTNIFFLAAGFISIAFILTFFIPETFSMQRRDQIDELQQNFNKSHKHL